MENFFPVPLRLQKNPISGPSLVVPVDLILLSVVEEKSLMIVSFSFSDFLFRREMQTLDNLSFL